MRIPARWATYLDAQHRLPRGVIGRLIGERMVRQHTPETDWSIDLLSPGPADRLLDIGCGAGRALSVALARMPGARIAGVDLSPVMLHATARRNRAARRAGQLTLVRGDITALPLATGCWDRVLSIHTIYFWPNLHDTMRALCELLAPGGRLAVTFATMRRLPRGEHEVWPIHARAETLVSDLRRAGHTVQLLPGPDSRQYNNVAIVVQA